MSENSVLIVMDVVLAGELDGALGAVLQHSVWLHSTPAHMGVGVLRIKPLLQSLAAQVPTEVGVGVGVGFLQHASKSACVAIEQAAAAHVEAPFALL